MELFKQFISYAPQVAAVIIIVVAGGGYVVRYFNKDGREEKSDVVSSANTIMEFWKNQAEQYKLISDEKDKSHNEKITSMTKNFTDQIAVLSREVGELKGQLTAETSQKKEYLAILQNRDPETKKFMEYMLQATKDHDDAHKMILRVLGEIHAFAKEEHNRELHIDATISKDVK